MISFGAPYLSASFMGQYAPYMWSIDTESNDVVQATSELYLKSLAGGNATYAGGSLQGKPRKVAIIAPSDPWYQSAAQSAVQQAAAGRASDHRQHPVPVEPVDAVEPGRRTSSASCRTTASRRWSAAVTRSSPCT